MAEIAPFKGIRYNPEKINELSKVTAPPYDVIDEAGRTEFTERDENNIVRLILPKPEGNTDQYTVARQILDRWLAEGVLTEDPEPGIYVISQQWETAGTRYTRTGFIAAVVLEPFGDGSIYPHENTLSAPKADRLKLIKTTEANLSQIFSIFPDEKNDVNAWLGNVTSRAADAESIDDQQVASRLWYVHHKAEIAKLVEMMSGREMFIADGHHRYETGLAYQAFRSQNDTPGDASVPCNAIMMLCVAMSDEGLVTFPTHRLLGAEVVEPEKLMDLLSAGFDVHANATLSGNSQKIDELLQNDLTPNLMVLYVGKDRPPMTVSPTEGVDPLEFMSAQSETWRSLDVSILQYAILDRLLGLTLEAVTSDAKIGYVHDTEEAMRAVDSGEFAAAFILRPTPVDSVAGVAAHFEKMPPKSTFFYPKAVTGMVLRRL